MTSPVSGQTLSCLTSELRGSAGAGRLSTCSLIVTHCLVVPRLNSAQSAQGCMNQNDECSTLAPSKASLGQRVEGCTWWPLGNRITNKYWRKIYIISKNIFLFWKLSKYNTTMANAKTMVNQSLFLRLVKSFLMETHQEKPVLQWSPQNTTSITIHPSDSLVNWSS